MLSKVANDLSKRFQDRHPDLYKQLKEVGNSIALKSVIAKANQQVAYLHEDMEMIPCLFVCSFSFIHLGVDITRELAPIFHRYIF